jgi:hypothetical protein
VLEPIENPTRRGPGVILCSLCTWLARRSARRGSVLCCFFAALPSPTEVVQHLTTKRRSVAISTQPVIARTTAGRESEDQCG